MRADLKLWYGTVVPYHPNSSTTLHSKKVHRDAEMHKRLAHHSNIIDTPGHSR